MIGEHVAGARAADEDRARDRVDAPEVEGRNVAGRRVATELAAGRVAHLELDDGAVVDLLCGLDRVVPDEVRELLAHVMHGAVHVVPCSAGLDGGHAIAG